MALRCKMMYSSNPRRLETLDVFDSEGSQIIRAIKSRMDGVECEAFYTFVNGKPHLERRKEKRRNTVINFIFRQHVMRNRR